MFFYYEQGNPRANKSPDIMVIFGVGNHERRSFRLWEEARGPSVIFEITSESSWREDLDEKKALYARLNIAEYFVFDPEHRWIAPTLQGFRLQDGDYEPLTPAADGSIFSQELGLRLRCEGHMLRLVDPRTNQPLRDLPEQGRATELERQRADAEEQRAEQEKQRAEAEQQRADQEKQRADSLAAEVARLRALLGQEPEQK
jgi:hypothetical protein